MHNFEALCSLFGHFEIMSMPTTIYPAWSIKFIMNGLVPRQKRILFSRYNPQNLTRKSYVIYTWIGYIVGTH
jgi:hypothetical protein